MDNWFTIEQIDRDTFAFDELSLLANTSTGKKHIVIYYVGKNMLFSLIQV